MICGPRAPRRRCSSPECWDWVEVECDFVLIGSRSGKTCDQGLCQRHAKKIDGKDYCLPHAKMVAAQPKLPL
jgi:hypothetical protein